MRRAHFHAVGRDAPFGGVKVDFAPTRGPQLCCADEGQHRKAERQPGPHLAIIATERSQELRQLSTRHSLVVRLTPRCLKRALQINRWVPPGTPSNDAVSENLTDRLPKPLCHFESAAHFDLTEYC